MVRGQIRGRHLVFLSEAEGDLVTMVPYNLVLLIFIASPAFAFHPFHSWFSSYFEVNNIGDAIEITPDTRPHQKPPTQVEPGAPTSPGAPGGSTAPGGPGTTLTLPPISENPDLGLSWFHHWINGNDASLHPGQQAPEGETAPADDDRLALPTAKPTPSTEPTKPPSGGNSQPAGGGDYCAIDAGHTMCRFKVVLGEHHISSL